MTDGPKAQADKFREMARKLEADESPEHFERVVQHVVSAPVPPKEAKPLHSNKPRPKTAKPGEP